mmetsp:Transcript_25866/g.61336  ORF Transcript_25866/g.61336 Transcript_25866/m.61336 type:complete len:397 (-) Transcript_25866:3486-4676(-)
MAESRTRHLDPDTASRRMLLSFRAHGVSLLARNQPAFLQPGRKVHRACRDVLPFDEDRCHHPRLPCRLHHNPWNFDLPLPVQCLRVSVPPSHAPVPQQVRQPAARRHPRSPHVAGLLRCHCLGHQQQRRGGAACSFSDGSVGVCHLRALRCDPWGVGGSAAAEPAGGAARPSARPLGGHGRPRVKRSSSGRRREHHDIEAARGQGAGRHGRVRLLLHPVAGAEASLLVHLSGVRRPPRAPPQASRKRPPVLASPAASRHGGVSAVPRPPRLLPAPHALRRQGHQGGGERPKKHPEPPALRRLEIRDLRGGAEAVAGASVSKHRTRDSQRDQPHGVRLWPRTRKKGAHEMHLTPQEVLAPRGEAEQPQAPGALPPRGPHARRAQCTRPCSLRGLRGI